MKELKEILVVYSEEGKNQDAMYNAVIDYALEKGIPVADALNTFYSLNETKQEAK